MCKSHRIPRSKQVSVLARFPTQVFVQPLFSPFSCIFTVLPAFCCAAYRLDPPPIHGRLSSINASSVFLSFFPFRIPSGFLPLGYARALSEGTIAVSDPPEVYGGSTLVHRRIFPHTDKKEPIPGPFGKFPLVTPVPFPFFLTFYVIFPLKISISS